MLSDNHLEKVCMYGSGTKQCRFLDNLNTGDCVCLKQTPQAITINSKVNTHIQSRKAKQLKPAIPVGNNCSGYTMLKHVLQGYDVK